MEKEYMKDYEGEIERYRQLLRSSTEVSEQNKKDIEDFVDGYCQEQNLAPPSTLKHIKTLRQLATYLKQDFRAVMNDRNAITRLLSQISRQNISENARLFGNKPKTRGSKTIKRYSPATMYEFRKELRTFYRWLNDGETCPLCVKYVKLGKKPEKEILPEELISYEEYHRIINGAETILDRAMISCHLESGARAGEFIPLRLRRVQPEGFFYRIDTIGKSGPRNFLLIESVPYLSQWMSSHPDKDNLDAYLWITTPVTKPSDLANFNAKYISRLRKICRKVGIRKRVWFHLGRHSQTTIMLKAGVPEKIIEKQMGWAPGSKMLSRYLHLSTQDTDNALAKRFGIEVGTQQPQNGPICPACHHVNPPKVTEFCGFCGAALSITKAYNAETKLRYEGIGTHLLDKLMENRHVQRMVTKLIERGDVKKTDLPVIEETAPNEEQLSKG